MNRILFTFIIFFFASEPSTWGQETSLFRRPPVEVASGLTGGGSAAPSQVSRDPAISIPFGVNPQAHPGLATSSWTYTPPQAPRVFRKHDIVTIRVDEIARVLAEGSAESRKVAQYQAVISEWFKISQGRVIADPQAEGDPGVAGQSNNQFRAESEVESRESLTFNIAASIVDIRPNGNLVLEATERFQVNDNFWSATVSGTCRPEDVAPDNVVLSRDLIDLDIVKSDQGQVRDGYKRGWFRKWLDRLQPF